MPLFPLMQTQTQRRQQQQQPQARVRAAGTRWTASAASLLRSEWQRAGAREGMPSGKGKRMPWLLWGVPPRLLESVEPLLGVPPLLPQCLPREPPLLATVASASCLWLLPVLPLQLLRASLQMVLLRMQARSVSAVMRVRRRRGLWGWEAREKGSVART